MSKWFGPAGTCGCCGGGVGTCQCGSYTNFDGSDCSNDYAGSTPQAISSAYITVSNVTDTYTHVATNDNDGTPYTETVTVSGLSILEGTYPATLVEPDTNSGSLPLYNSCSQSQPDICPVTDLLDPYDCFWLIEFDPVSVDFFFEIDDNGTVDSWTQSASARFILGVYSSGVPLCERKIYLIIEIECDLVVTCNSDEQEIFSFSSSLAPGWPTNSSSDLDIPPGYGGLGVFGGYTQSQSLGSCITSDVSEVGRQPSARLVSKWWSCQGPMKRWSIGQSLFPISLILNEPNPTPNRTFATFDEDIPAYSFTDGAGTDHTTTLFNLAYTFTVNEVDV